MKDLTAGSISRHLLATTSFMLVTMVVQTLYFLVDLYWVGRLGTAAVAAVGIAGNLSFLVLALSQMLGVGTTTVISHAVGRRDHPHALDAFRQSQVLAAITGAVFFVVFMLLRERYVMGMAADVDTAREARSYLLWFIPALALQFPMVAMSSALRATGNFKPGMIVSSATVVINMALAPVLIFGWGTGVPLGVAGAAIASMIAILVGIVWLSTYFVHPNAFLRFTKTGWRVRPDLWNRMLTIGLPAGVEFALMAVYMVVVYAITQPFGAAAQAGFGIGMRIVQAGFMPVVALGFAVAPVAGQNFGAGQHHRVRATFRDAALLASGVMLLFAVASQAAPAALIGAFTRDAAVVAIGAEYLRIVSWNYLASGLIFIASSMFQAMGNTVPSLVASVVRTTVACLPAILLARLPGFQLRWIWYLSVFSVLIQFAVSMVLLRREFSRRLGSPMLRAAA